MSEREIIAGLLNVIEGLVDQQAMQDDWWMEDKYYLAAKNLETGENHDQDSSCGPSETGLHS